MVIISCLSRYLGTEGFGIYSFIFFYVGLFGILTDMGLNTILTRDMARDKAHEAIIFGNGILIRFVLTLLTLMLACAIILFTDHPESTVRLVWLFAFVLFLSFRMITFRQVYDVPFQVRLKMGRLTGVNVLNELLTLGLILWGIRIRASLSGIILIFVLANLPGFIMSIAFSGRLIRPLFKPSLKICSSLIFEAFPVGLSGIFMSAYAGLGGVMLSMAKGDVETGYYGLGYRLAASLWIIPFAIMTSMFPRMSAHAKSSSDKLKKLYKDLLKTMVIIAIPIGLLGSLFAHRIVLLVGGREFSPSATIFSILVWQVALYHLTILFFFTLNAIGKQHLNSLNTGLMLVTNIILNLILINRFGSLGASWALVLTEFQGALVGWYLVSREGRRAR